MPLRYGYVKEENENRILIKKKKTQDSHLPAASLS